jgi:uridine kinase
MRAVGERGRILTRVADLVGPGVSRVAVDGVDGVGKSVFAGELAGVLRSRGRPVAHVSADGFHQPRARRYRRGRGSPEGFWLDSYDYPALIDSVLAPFGPGGSRCFRAASHDLESDEMLDLPWQRAPADAVLVVDGLFLHRDELAGHWDLSVFLTAPFAVTAGRMAARDGSHPDPEHPSMARYVGGQRLYFDACRPWERADVVIDNSDFDRPALVTSE